jgi:UDP-2,4-diacetamido-2,4,6-trideoxy-beta-L-altropyranose hydrolase
VSLRVAIRVDASTDIGIGHVMRCLTLADALGARGACVRFVSRHLPRHLEEIVRRRGHEIVLTGATGPSPLDELGHAEWLGTSQQADADATADALGVERWDAAIVDHYALDVRWESAVRRVVQRIVVIDDLADRVHDCDILLDQNVYAGMETRYADLVPRSCTQFIGPHYALVRPEFREWRARVAPRAGAIERVLVAFGGVDAGDLTGSAIRALRSLPADGWKVDVVVGASHPRLHGVRADCAAAGFALHVQSDRMAELMAAADLALGAAGSTSWERCAVGLPTVCAATAHNQVAIAQGLEEAGASLTVTGQGGIRDTDLVTALAALAEDPARVARMSRAAWDLVDGLGARRVADAVLGRA